MASEQCHNCFQVAALRRRKTFSAVSHLGDATTFTIDFTTFQLPKMIEFYSEGRRDWEKLEPIKYVLGNIFQRKSQENTRKNAIRRLQKRMLWDRKNYRVRSPCFSRRSLRSIPISLIQLIIDLVENSFSPDARKQITPWCIDIEPLSWMSTLTTWPSSRSSRDHAKWSTRSTKAY